MKVAFETLGCRSNFADSVAIQTSLVAEGAEITDFHHQADVYVLNTCTVTNGADLEAYKIVRRIRSRNPQARIVVMGCLAELGFQDLQERQIVDAVVGNSNKAGLIAAISGVEPPGANKTNANSALSLNEPLSSATLGPGQGLGDIKMRARFHLRIQDGCNNFCSYCIVPFARGNPVSKDPNLVISDLKLLCSKGYEEVILSGTHLGAYGKDIGIGFYNLLERIDRSGIDCRIRLSSLDPQELSFDIIDLLAESSLFCEHLHLCFQSFSDKLLKRMNRKYTIKAVEKNIDYVHKRLPKWCIGSDVIVGFPGESREDVDQAIKSFLDLPISYLHVFPYSERKQTKATELDGSVPVEERRKRAGLWRQLSTERRNQYLSTLVGETVEIIVEKKISPSIVVGTSREYAQCELKVDSTLDSSLTLGSRKKVRVRTVNTEEESLLCVL